MKCRSFILRINHEYTEADEARISEFIARIRVFQINSNIVAGDPPYWSIVIFYDQWQQSADDDAFVSQFYEDLELSREEIGIYDGLVDWRTKKAAREGVLPYTVAPNACLKQIVRAKVTTTDALLGILGFGEHRVRKYGDEIIALLETLRRDPPIV